MAADTCSERCSLRASAAKVGATMGRRVAAAMPDLSRACFHAELDARSDAGPRIPGRGGSATLSRLLRRHLNRPLIPGEIIMNFDQKFDQVRRRTLLAGASTLAGLLAADAA